MAKPAAYFNFNANGLSVTFTDGSSGIIVSWAWDFGFKDGDNNEVISTLQNPEPVVFPASGSFSISLTVTNNDGSNTFTFPISVNSTPGLNISIRQMVQYNLPIGLSFDSIGFDQSIRQWQLYLQAAGNILDADVFNESKWPPLYNVLISKLIIMDLVVKAATASMSSYISAAESLNALASQTTSSTIQVADYTVSIDQSFPFVVNIIIANGVSYGPSPSFANAGQLVNWLNSLGVGGFAITQGEGDFISSFGNSAVLTTFNFTANAVGTNSAFTQSNARIVQVTSQLIISGGANGIGAKGALKSLETGPSKAQWYDSSVYWATIMKSAAADGSGGGIMSSIQEEICLYAGKLTVKLPGCTNDKTLVKSFKVAKGRARNSWLGYNSWPPSNDRSSHGFF